MDDGIINDEIKDEAKKDEMQNVYQFDDFQIVADGIDYLKDDYDFEEYYYNTDPFYTFVKMIEDDDDDDDNFIENAIKKEEKAFKYFKNISEYEIGLEPMDLYKKILKYNNTYYKIAKKYFMGINTFFEVMLYLINDRNDSKYLLTSLLFFLNKNAEQFEVKLDDLLFYALEKANNVVKNPEEIENVYSGINSNEKKTTRKKVSNFQIGNKNGITEFTFDKYEKIPIYHRINGKMQILKNNNGKELYLYPNGEIAEFNGNNIFKINEEILKNKEMYISPTQILKEGNIANVNDIKFRPLYADKNEINVPAKYLQNLQMKKITECKIKAIPSTIIANINANKNNNMNEFNNLKNPNPNRNIMANENRNQNQINNEIRLENIINETNPNKIENGKENRGFFNRFANLLGFETNKDENNENENEDEDKVDIVAVITSNQNKN